MLLFLFIWYTWIIYMLTIDVLHQHRVKNAGKTLWGDPCEKRWTEVGPWCGLHGGAQGSSYHARHRRCCGGMEPTEPCEEDEEQLGWTPLGRKLHDCGCMNYSYKITMFFFGGGGDEIILCKIVHWNFDMWVFKWWRHWGLSCTCFLVPGPDPWGPPRWRLYPWGEWHHRKRHRDSGEVQSRCLPSLSDIVLKRRNPATVTSWHGQQKHVCFLMFFDRVKHDVSCIFRFLCFFLHRGAAFLPLNI